MPSLGLHECCDESHAAQARREEGSGEEAARKGEAKRGEGKASDMGGK